MLKTLNQKIGPLLLESSSKLSDAEVTFLFVQCRVHLEASEEKGRYPTISRFGNWLLHSELSNKGTTKELISKLAKGIENHLEDSGTYKIDQIMKDIVGLDILRCEMKRYFLENDLSSSLFEENASWHELASSILVLIAGRPFYFESIGSSKIKHDYNGFMISVHEGNIVWELISPKLKEINSRVIGYLIK